MKSLSASTFLFFFTISCLSGVQNAVGQGVVVADTFDDQAEANYLDYTPQYFGYLDQFGVTNTGLDFTDARNAPYSGAGFTGLGKADQTAYYIPSNPGLSGNFGFHHADAHASGAVTASGNWYAEYATGIPFGYVEFTVAQPTFWQIGGNAWGMTDSVASGFSQSEYLLRFYDFSNNTYLVLDSAQASNGIGNYNLNFNHNGLLTPGKYGYEYRTFSLHGGNSDSPTTLGSASSGISTTLVLVTVPEPTGLLLSTAGFIGLLRSRRGDLIAAIMGARAPSRQM